MTTNLALAMTTGFSDIVVAPLGRPSFVIRRQATPAAQPELGDSATEPLGGAAKHRVRPPSAGRVSAQASTMPPARISFGESLSITAGSGQETRGSATGAIWGSAPQAPWALRQRLARYRALSLGAVPSSSGSRVRKRMQVRKLQLDAFDHSTTVLCAERLETQASDAFVAAAARVRVLKGKQERVPKVGNYIEAWLHRKKICEVWL